MPVPGLAQNRISRAPEIFLYLTYSRLPRLSFGLNWHCIFAAAFAVGVSSCSFSKAYAFELFGKCIIGECENNENSDLQLIDPHTYSVDLSTPEETPENIVGSLRSSSSIWLGRESAVAGSASLVARAKGDYRRLLAALYNEGYYAGSISITINGREAAGLAAGDQLPFESAVVIRVEPGTFYWFDKTEIENRAPLPVDPKDIVDLPENRGFLPGQVAKAGNIRLAGKLSVEAWRQQGFPLAKVASRSATAVHADRQLNVTLRMQPGPQAVFGDVAVEGQHRMDPDFIAYMTGIEPGREYDPDEIKKAQMRLDRLAVFSTRKIIEAEQVSTGGLLPLHVVVSERKRRSIGLGASLSSIDGASLEGYWLHRNLFGKAESLRFDAKIGGIGPEIEPDKLDYLLSTSFTVPGVLSPDTDLVSNVYAKREFNDLYTETSAGGSFVLNNYYSTEITYSAGLFGSYGEYDDVFGTRGFLTTGLQGDIVYDYRDSSVEPTRGIYARFATQPFYEWEFGNTAARLEAEARTYLALGEDKRSVIAGRVKVGSLLGPPLSQVPSNMLFTAGGGNSVRGFGFKSIGVDQPGGLISGGKSLFETSVELRQRITESFGAVAFVDAGTVGGDSHLDFSEGLKGGVGLGIRYYTGLGPIRLDVAVPLNPDTGDTGFAVYAGIGQAF